MATFSAKIPYLNIVPKLNFFKNQRQTIQVWYQGENRDFEEITPFISLEDEYGTISGLLSIVRTSVETVSHRYPSFSNLHGMIPSKSNNNNNNNNNNNI